MNHIYDSKLYQDLHMQSRDPRKLRTDSLCSDDNRSRFRYRKDHKQKELSQEASFHPGNLQRPLK